MKKGTVKKNKSVKKGKRRMKLLNVSASLFVLTGGLYLITALFVRSYNNSLSTQAQEISTEIVNLQSENDSVQYDIDTLASRERVSQIATSDGMTSNSDSVITITASSDTSSED